MKPHTIANCFNHYQIRIPDVDELQVTNEVDEENQRVIVEFSDQIRQLHYTNRMDINVFLNHPNEQ